MSLTHRVPLTHDHVLGAAALLRDERGLVVSRLPEHAEARGADAMLLMAGQQPSGVRVAFTSTASVVEVHAIAIRRSHGGTPRPPGVHELVVDGVVVASGSLDGGDLMDVDPMTGAPTGLVTGSAGTLRFEVPGPVGVTRRVEVWLPHDEATRLVEVRTDAPVTPVPAGRRWLHHGSSISQGSNATHPTGTWPAVAARRAGWELVNRSYGGSALLDPFTADHLARTPADLVSLKIGINVVNLDLMRRRAFVPALHGFLDRVRAGHPDVPLWLVTPVLCPIHERTPGPALPDPEALAEGRLAFRATGSPEQVAFGALTLEGVREAVAQVHAARRTEDPQLHLLNGLELYGEADHDRHPLPDALHPAPQTHVEMGERFADLVLSRA